VIFAFSPHKRKKSFLFGANCARTIPVLPALERRKQKGVGAGVARDACYSAGADGAIDFPLAGLGAAPRVAQ
jgi:hypothetical protein